MSAVESAGMRRLLLVGVPIVYAVLMLFHPTGEGDVYEALHDHAQRWQAVHVVQLVFIGLLAVAMYQILDGLSGRWATVSRVALAPFVLFYAAFEAIAGIGTGILVDYAHDLPADEQAMASGMIQAYWENPIAGNLSAFSAIGSLSWWIAVGGSVVALRQAAAPRSALVLLGTGGLMFGIGHAPPFGPIGLVLIALSMVWLGKRPVASELPASSTGMAFNGMAKVTSEP